MELGRIQRYIWYSLILNPSLLYADDLILCGESEVVLMEIVERFAEACRRRGLKGNAGKSKVMVLNGEDGLEY